MEEFLFVEDKIENISFKDQKLSVMDSTQEIERDFGINNNNEILRAANKKINKLN